MLHSLLPKGDFKKMAIKFITDRKTLLSLIQPAMTATSNKSTLPALEGLLFNLERDGVLTRRK